jgi:hypothetical protein
MDPVTPPPMPPEDAAKCVEICDLVAQGQSLNKICQQDGFPAKSTFLFWVMRYPDLADQYTRAREIQADVLVDEINDIADDSSADYGFRESEDGSGQSAKKVFLPEHVARAKLRIDTRKWQAGKQRPKKYGDLTTLKHEGEITISIAERLQKARERAQRG